MNLAKGFPGRIAKSCSFWGATWMIVHLAGNQADAFTSLSTLGPTDVMQIVHFGHFTVALGLFCGAFMLFCEPIMDSMNRMDGFRIPLSEVIFTGISVTFFLFFALLWWQDLGITLWYVYAFLLGMAFPGGLAHVGVYLGTAKR